MAIYDAVVAAHSSSVRTEPKYLIRPIVSALGNHSPWAEYRYSNAQITYGQCCHACTLERCQYICNDLLLSGLEYSRRLSTTVIGNILTIDIEQRIRVTTNSKSFKSPNRVVVSLSFMILESGRKLPHCSVLKSGDCVSKVSSSWKWWAERQRYT